jgi:hypothetical protein
MREKFLHCASLTFADTSDSSVRGRAFSVGGRGEVGQPLVAITGTLALPIFSDCPDIRQTALHLHVQFFGDVADAAKFAGPASLLGGRC